MFSAFRCYRFVFFVWGSLASLRTSSRITSLSSGINLSSSSASMLCSTAKSSKNSSGMPGAKTSKVTRLVQLKSTNPTIRVNAVWRCVVSETTFDITWLLLFHWYKFSLIDFFFQLDSRSSLSDTHLIYDRLFLPIFK